MGITYEENSFFMGVFPNTHIQVKIIEVPPLAGEHIMYTLEVVGGGKGGQRDQDPTRPPPRPPESNMSAIDFTASIEQSVGHYQRPYIRETMHSALNL